MARKTLNIGLVGYGFMGRTHSNAFLQAPRFFDLRYRPILEAVCAHNAERAQGFAENWGYQSAELSGENWFSGATCLSSRQRLRTARQRPSLGMVSPPIMYRCNSKFRDDQALGRRAVCLAELAFRKSFKENLCHIAW
jgi:hypothetical protein